MEERNCYVYEDYRIDNWTCCYVGMGSKNEETGYNRFEVAERNEHHDNIMNSCGIARVIIRDNLTREEANALEEARIYYYVFVLGYTIDIKGYRKGKKSDSHLTNMTWGGDGVKGCKHSEETKKKLSEALKGKTHSEETKKKISEAMKGEKNPNYGRTGEKHPMYGVHRYGEKAPMYGKHHSEETKKKISENHADFKREKHPMYGVHRYGEKAPMYGKHHSEETKKKISEAMKGHEVSEEIRKKIGEVNKGENNPFYGKHHSEETKKKIGEANGRKVRCVETGEIFNTVTKASKWCGSYRNCITRQIQGKQKSAGKHPITGEKLHWEYVD